MNDRILDKYINMVRNLHEEAPVNSVGGGNIAGTREAGDDPPVRRKKKYICLLYTSPSPRDKRQSRMPSSA